MTLPHASEHDLRASIIASARRLTALGSTLTRALALCLLMAFPGTAPAGTGGVPRPVVMTPSTATTPILALLSARERRTMSLAALESLPMYRVTTPTFWPRDDGVYEGPLLLDVLKTSGMDKAEALRIMAKDGFSQVIPREDWTRWPIILATRRGGEPMTTRNKGPIRIIYPRGMDPELSNPKYRLRWVWMITSIEALPPKRP